MSSDHQSRTSFTLFLTLITETRTFQNTPLSSTELSLLFLSPWISGYILFRTTDTENSADERPACPPDRYSPLPCYTCSHLCCPARRRGVLDVRVSSWLVCWGSTSCPSALALSPSLPLNCSHLLVQRALFYLKHE